MFYVIAVNINIIICCCCEISIAEISIAKQAIRKICPCEIRFTKITLAEIYIMRFTPCDAYTWNIEPKKRTIIDNALVKL